MQKEMVIQRILSYLFGKQLEEFSGGIKMGFENGKPVSFSETFCPDKGVLEAKDNTGFDLETFIDEACKDKFFGTLYLVYSMGKLTHYNRVRTIQGQVLQSILGCHEESPKPFEKRVIKVRGHAQMPKMQR